MAGALRLARVRLAPHRCLNAAARASPQYGYLPRVSTDPYVVPADSDTPRQAQNLAPGVAMPPARAWRLHRPGDEVAIGQPHGELLGEPGPNIGYALTLVHRAQSRFALAPHEHFDDAAAVVGELAMRRAASYGRAPVAADVESAMLVFGYQGGCAPDFAAWRATSVQGAHHDYPRRRALVEAVPIDELRLTPQALAGRVEELRPRVRAFARAGLMIPLLLSPEHEELRRALRRFAEEQVAPHAAEADERSEFPWKSFEGYRSSGFIRLPYPVEHGGDGGDAVAYAMLVEEVARVLRVLGAPRAHLPPRVRADPGARLVGARRPRRTQGRDGGVAGLVLPLGAAGGQRRHVDDDPSRARRRPLRAERPQGVGQQRRDLRLLHRVRRHRPGRQPAPAA